jgi:hypothetical protein
MDFVGPHAKPVGVRLSSARFCQRGSRGVRRPEPEDQCVHLDVSDGADQKPSAKATKQTTAHTQVGNRISWSAFPCAIFARSAGDTGSAPRNARARALDANG